MTTIQIDLADILEGRLQFGFSIPVPIDVSQLLEYADDDWRHDLDLEDLLSEQRKVAVIISAGDIKRNFPHLTEGQAWEIAAGIGDHMQGGLEDWISDAVYMDYPSSQMKLLQRARSLKSTLSARTDDPATTLLAETNGLLRLINKLEGAPSDPALEGKIAATLDDIETSMTKKGGAE